MIRIQVKIIKHVFCILYFIGICKCFGGFAGGDCSVSTNQPPALTAAFTENRCDVNRTLCQEVPVFGSNFHKSLSLQCRLQEKEVSVF